MYGGGAFGQAPYGGVGIHISALSVTAADSFAISDIATVGRAVKASDSWTWTSAVSSVTGYQRRPSDSWSWTDAATAPGATASDHFTISDSAHVFVGKWQDLPVKIELAPEVYSVTVRGGAALTLRAEQPTVRLQSDGKLALRTNDSNTLKPEPREVLVDG